MKENNFISNEQKINKLVNERIRKLTFADDFVFYSVLVDNPDICKTVIESCIGKPIDKIVYTNGQEAMKLMAEGKGIRMDVYAKDADHTLYDIEMQTVKGAHLGKRSRYYDSVMTLNSLEVGDTYDQLPESYVIFVCAFDPFQGNRAVYRFCNREEQDHNLLLKDGSHKILLNAYGDVSECTPEQKQFLAAVRGEIVSDHGLDRKISEAVERLKRNERWKMAYITIEAQKMDYIRRGREEGREEGRKEGRNEGREEGRKEGREEGREEGKIEGELIAYYKFVRDGIITLRDGAERAGMTEAEFKAGMDAYFA